MKRLAQGQRVAKSQCSDQGPGRLNPDRVPSAPCSGYSAESRGSSLSSGPGLVLLPEILFSLIRGQPKKTHQSPRDPS